MSYGPVRDTSFFHCCFQEIMGEQQHSLTMTVCGLVSFTVTTPSAFVALAAVGMVCATVIAVEYIKSEKSKNWFNKVDWWTVRLEKQQCREQCVELFS